LSNDGRSVIKTTLAIKLTHDPEDATIERQGGKLLCERQASLFSPACETRVSRAAAARQMYVPQERVVFVVAKKGVALEAGIGTCFLGPPILRRCLIEAVKQYDLACVLDEWAQSRVSERAHEYHKADAG
jgi:hypothetical protein